MSTEWNNVTPGEINPMVKLMQERAQSFTNSAWAQPKGRPNMGGAPGSQEEGYGFAADGYGNNVPRSLIHSESGGNWMAQNNAMGSGGKAGHYGALQFGHARLEDAKRAGIIPADMTPQQFMANPQAQVATGNWHFNDIDNRIRQSGYDKYIGQNIGGTIISMDGMRSMAHLGGFGGLSKYISTGGRYNPSDVNGTSLAKYGKQHRS